MAMKNLGPLIEQVAAENATEYKRTGGMAKDMSLRDHFAAIALQGILSWVESTSDRVELFSVTAYQYADAMLKVRRIKG